MTAPRHLQDDIHGYPRYDGELSRIYTDVILD
ncbi:hypothetical protein ACP_1575 [Acidobacterium capsulatum ATCC 51196]|uniref:Uncharacterized protein n=1 Tax=Acidobacterium capsulatum (strain ATCC 51196 / DSM 11244 / BCRC 80197 / JCM 7670 / NBRC 15755 / NCIMB 13165 / 161) TaxID=240015 RepID=C1F6R7_ACIC5|nr:hypothetical protein ACP_1575 [Acidobacterium capsulatum ATCC 51196]